MDALEHVQNCCLHDLGMGRISTWMLEKMDIVMVWAWMLWEVNALRVTCCYGPRMDTFQHGRPRRWKILPWRAYQLVDMPSEQIDFIVALGMPHKCTSLREDVEMHLPPPQTTLSASV